MRAPARMRTIVCVNCGNDFQGNHSQAKYCSPECKRVFDRKSWRKYGERNRDRRNAYHREHYEKNKEEIIARTSVYSKTERGKQAKRISDLNVRNKYPEKHKARHQVSVAIQKGLLVSEPCKCGESKTEAHHPDYSKPLDVIWMCKPCHLKLHKILRRQNENG